MKKLNFQILGNFLLIGNGFVTTQPLDFQI
jgi:hypothetical protein